MFVRRGTKPGRRGEGTGQPTDRPASEQVRPYVGTARRCAGGPALPGRAVLGPKHWHVWGTSSRSSADSKVNESALKVGTWSQRRSHGDRRWAGHSSGQITAEWCDTETEVVRRGVIRGADRQRLRRWLEQFEGERVELAFEGCTGWR